MRTARMAAAPAVVAVLAACARARDPAGGPQDSVEIPGPSAVGRGWAGRLRPPAGADSAAVEAWIAAQRPRCAGRVVRVYTDFPVAESVGAPFRLRRYFEGIECQQP